MNPEVWLLALLLYREVRNQRDDAMLAVGCSVRNRVSRPRWWGHDWVSVILMPEQYSSFNSNDPNSRKFARKGELVWSRCWAAAEAVYNGTAPDTVDGADSYYDKSMDSNPPAWTSHMEHVTEVGSFHFFRTPKAISA